MHEVVGDLLHHAGPPDLKAVQQQAAVMDTFCELLSADMKQPISGLPVPDAGFANRLRCMCEWLFTNAHLGMHLSICLTTAAM